jgi:hypothetical protein
MYLPLGLIGLTEQVIKSFHNFFKHIWDAKNSEHASNDDQKRSRRVE